MSGFVLDLRIRVVSYRDFHTFAEPVHLSGLVTRCLLLCFCLLIKSSLYVAVGIIIA